jgi:hypothetical protein
MLLQRGGTEMQVLLLPGPRHGGRGQGQIRSSSLAFCMLPLVWYSVTRVSKKFFSLRRNITSSSHGNGFVFT